MPMRICRRDRPVYGTVELDTGAARGTGYPKFMLDRGEEEFTDSRCIKQWLLSCF